VPTDLFTRLDEDWSRFTQARDAKPTLARWGVAEPALSGFSSFDALLGALQGRTDPAWRDRRMLALLGLARSDQGARRVALQVVRPALSCIARLYSARWGAEDAGSEVIATALQRIATFPTDRRRTNLAGHIVQDVRHYFFKALEREMAFEDAFTTTEVTTLECEIVAPQERTAADRVASIISDALRAGRITPRHAQLVIDTRLGGVPIEDIAAAWQRSPQTVRRMRQRVERALADVAVA
jgi:DNA-directed RNA polymerase specialized sigma24 family protein